eukprot:6389336-Prymnesium_polylepis.1
MGGCSTTLSGGSGSAGGGAGGWQAAQHLIMPSAQPGALFTDASPLGAGGAASAGCPCRRLTLVSADQKPPCGASNVRGRRAAPGRGFEQHIPEAT